jgi:hypothetical protein
MRPTPVPRNLPSLAVVLTLCSAAVLVAEPAPKGPAIRLTKEAFEVTGLDRADLDRLAKAKLEPAEWTALFAVYVDNGSGGDTPAVIGSYRVADDVLRFEPRFPPAPGTRYRTVFDPARLPGASGKPPKVVAELSLPKPPQAAATAVERVYPSSNKLPENQLKFYVHFSAPMSRGEAYEHIRLLDEAGKPIKAAFLELGEELWDPQGKRFTLFIDPGRIKKGLKPREDLGPVLEDGKRYTLEIDAKWSDAQGNRLKEAYRKTFRAGPADEQAIDPKAWKLQLPAAGKAEALTVNFPEPLDHALLHRLLTVTDAKGQAVSGSVSVTDEETRWHFTPEKPWQAGAYNLVVDTALEDLAGNRVGQPFEVDVFRPVERQANAKTVSLPFQVAAPKKKPAEAFTDPDKAGPDFAVQGEYDGELGKDRAAAQVIAEGDGKFTVVFLPGGLPGAGGDGKTRVKAQAKTEDGKTTVSGNGWAGEVADGRLAGKSKDGVPFRLNRVVRQSPAAGEKPPEGAVILFDGSGAGEWNGGKLVEGNLLAAGPTTKRTFRDFKLHVEFCTPFRPAARGQERANSGVYLQGRYEIQILDSFGLEAKNNDCAAVYEATAPSVNLCLPPLSWQTFDIDFRMARFDADGKKTANARVSVVHNGVKVHDNVEIKGPTGHGQEEKDTPGPINLQNHGNPVVFRNIWLVPTGP